MHMALKVHRWTRADLVSLPDDGNRYEVLDGKLFVTPLPSPLHQWIAFRLMHLIEPYVARHSLGTVLGPSAVIFGPNELQPDVAVLPVSPRKLPRTWKRVPRALLVVEVLSPTTRMRDLTLKRVGYRRSGIPDYWVIDPEEREAVCWSSKSREPRIESAELTWQPRGELPPLDIRLGDILP